MASRAGVVQVVVTCPGHVKGCERRRSTRRPGRWRTRSDIRCCLSNTGYPWVRPLTALAEGLAAAAENPPRWRGQEPERDCEPTRDWAPIRDCVPLRDGAAVRGGRPLPRRARGGAPAGRAGRSAAGGGGGSGVPVVAISRTTGCPAATWCRAGSTPAAWCSRWTSRTWSRTASVTTRPVAPALAVRPDRCR